MTAIRTMVSAKMANTPAAPRYLPARARMMAERAEQGTSVISTEAMTRSAIILALAGKYLGATGVFAIFALTIVLIAVMGRLLARRRRELGPGQVQEIPPYALPRWRTLLSETWERTRDVLTIVTPLLVGGSVLLALLNHVGADSAINA